MTIHIGQVAMGYGYGGDHWGETTGQGDGSVDAYDLNCLVAGERKDSKRRVMEQIERETETPEMRKYRMEAEQARLDMQRRVDAEETRRNVASRQFQISEKMATGKAGGLFGEEED